MDPLHMLLHFLTFSGLTKCPNYNTVIIIKTLTPQRIIAGAIKNNAEVRSLLKTSIREDRLELCLPSYDVDVSWFSAHCQGGGSLSFWRTTQTWTFCFDVKKQKKKSKTLDCGSGGQLSPPASPLAVMHTLVKCASTSVRVRRSQQSRESAVAKRAIRARCCHNSGW